MAFKDRISGMFRFGAKDKPKTKQLGQDAAAAISQAGADDEAETLSATELATVEEREALLRQLSHGFVHVGSTIERLDENLAAGTRSLEAMTVAQERLPALLAEQQHLIQEVTETASASRRALEALSEHLQQRDTAQQAIVERLEALGQGMAEQRDAHRQQLDLVMGFHRSSRMFTALLIFGGFLLVLLLLGALVLVLLRPQLVAGAGATTAQLQHGPAAPAAAAVASEAPAMTGSHTTAPAIEPTVSGQPAAPATDPDRSALLEAAAASNDATVARRARAALEAAE